jgi:sRNA-binding protein
VYVSVPYTARRRDTEYQIKTKTRHTPHATRHTPHATRHTPHATRHTPHATRHTPHATRHTPHATRHTPHATRHTPHATRHTPHVTRHTASMLTVADASAVHGDCDAVPNLSASITYRARRAMCGVTTLAFLICFRCDCTLRLEATRRGRHCSGV